MSDTQKCGKSNGAVVVTSGTSAEMMPCERKLGGKRGMGTGQLLRAC